MLLHCIIKVLSQQSLCVIYIPTCFDISMSSTGNLQPVLVKLHVCNKVRNWLQPPSFDMKVSKHVVGVQSTQTDYCDTDF
jgi:hypothetical protein